MPCWCPVACIAQFFAVHPATMLLQPAGVYGYSLIHATLNTVVPVFMLMWAVARIGAPTASLLGMVGPVSVLFLAAWFLDEPITAWQMAGTALVLAGVLVLTAGARPRAEYRFLFYPRYSLTHHSHERRPAWPAISSRQFVSSSMAVPRS